MFRVGQVFKKNNSIFEIIYIDKILTERPYKMKITNETCVYNCWFTKKQMEELNDKKNNTLETK